MNAAQLQMILDEKKQYLKEAFHVKEIGIFGSFVRGEETVLSDIDILVSFEKGHKDIFNYMRLKDCLEKLIGWDVDLVIKEAVKPGLRGKILSEVRYV